jgi:hypothetical protein
VAAVDAGRQADVALCAPLRPSAGAASPERPPGSRAGGSDRGRPDGRHRR